jgi:hypothetical protein
MMNLYELNGTLRVWLREYPFDPDPEIVDAHFERTRGSAA